MPKYRKARTRRRLSGETLPAYTPKIALRSIAGHVARTSETTTAWYRLPPQRWSFRSDSTRIELIQAIAGQYAELQGRWLHIRVTSRPYPIAEWAVAHHRQAGADRLPDVPGAQSWNDFVVGEQQQLHGHSMLEKEVYVGVEVRRRGAADVLVERAEPLLRKVAPKLLDAELMALDTEISYLDNLMAGRGMQARPATPLEMRWLLQRSCMLGLPAPDGLAGVGDGVWDGTDIAAFTDGATAWCEDPYAPTVTVRGRTGKAADVERHVAVLSVGLMQPQDIPRSELPWMVRTDALPFQIEWSARIYVRTPEEVQSELTRNMAKVTSQVRHYSDEHGLEPPQSLARQFARAHDIDDELSGTWGPLNTRVRGWWRIAVSGASRTEALQRAQQVVDLYKPKVAIEHPEAQYALYREFIPGEPLASQAYQRRGSVQWAAAAVPAAAAEVGDRRGILLGETASTSRRPVAWDPWASQELRDGSGLTALVAGLGGGKSFLGAGIVYKTLRAGAYWTVLDPSGPLAALCELPELRPYAKAINLLQAEPGTLNPYRVVPEPRKEFFAGSADPEGEYRRERSRAAAERRRLCLDVLKGILPYELAHKPETDIVLMHAVRATGGSPLNHPGLVIDRLKSHPNEDLVQHSHAVYEFLDEARDRLELLIPRSPESDPYRNMREDHRLTVLTMPGLILPHQGQPRQDWTDTEALGVELLSLAAWLTQRRVYSGDSSYTARTGRAWKHARKGVWIDEAFFLSDVPTGRALMNRFTRDSRKWNVRVLLSSQIPGDLLKIDGFSSLLDSVFVGSLDDAQVQADALRLLRVPQGAGYERVLSQLAGRRATANKRGDEGEPRQFIFNDGAGGIERIRIDFSGPHLAQLRQALNTTPNSKSVTKLQLLPTLSTQKEGAA